MEALDLEWGVASRALPGESSCGDLHVFEPLPQGALVGVLDGLGHGSDAAHAAQTARAILIAHAAEPVISLIQRCHEGLRTTRGVAMSIASVDTFHGLMTWVGVGNVRGLLLRRGSAAEESLLLRSGVVGAQVPLLRAEVLCVFPGDALILATDGISSDFSSKLARALPPQEATERILAENGKTTDDALVLVARYRGK
jgi:negative regulator of sigma-B (phosphoserine phosphatase)